MRTLTLVLLFSTLAVTPAFAAGSAPPTWKNEKFYIGDQMRDQFQTKVLDPLSSRFPGVSMGTKNKVTGATLFDRNGFSFGGGQVYSTIRPPVEYVGPFKREQSGPPARGQSWPGVRFVYRY